MKDKLLIAAVILALGTVSAQAEIDTPWKSVNDTENPFSEKNVGFFAGSAWIGGARGIRIECDGDGFGSIMEISDFDMKLEYYDYTLSEFAIAVDGEVVFSSENAQTVELTSGKVGVSDKGIPPEKLAKLAKAMIEAKKSIYVKGAYEGGQKITVRGSTAAGKELLACTEKSLTN